ncbi:DinB family protein [Membranicola marinus]|uniref:DinB family protein n=1 Tax=Membranihabitans marinus TaxID=1227546 RepID=A0A953HXJ1_9BACT|nr:DinB family protein [Membranihabitans marinus]MBY5960040.1 DinB family protein [Membranihabitans marinus]
MMTTKELLTKELHRSTRDFVSYLKEYAAKEIEGPLSQEKWTMSQVIQHVILVDRSVLGLVQQSFDQTKDGHYHKYKIRDLLLNRHQKVKNPKDSNPAGDQQKSISDWLEEFQTGRQKLIGLIENDQIDLDSEAAYPHFVLGDLTRRDWLYLVCFHSDRHIAQIQEDLFCASTF